MIMMINELKNKLGLRECDFLIDVLMTSRDNCIKESARCYDVDALIIVEKLAAQADILDGVDNKFND